MAVQFAQPYRFSEQQLACLANAGIVSWSGTDLIDGVPHRADGPVRFSSEAYDRLAEIGVLATNERVELIDGEIIAMSPEGSRHSACVIRLIRLLLPRVGDALVSAHGSLVLPDQYRPMPDVTVLRASGDEYEHAHPTHEDVLVVIEVSDTSLRYDRHVKSGRYAHAGIPEYWLVDLTRNEVSVHQRPVAGDYADVRVYRSGQSWPSPGLGGAEVAVDDVLKAK